MRGVKLLLILLVKLMVLIFCIQTAEPSPKFNSCVLQAEKEISIICVILHETCITVIILL